ncbi:MAG: hypothetical protein K0Q61_860 [Rhodococcus erythropolis]|nr:hypothetical protein [Rhodococcus erythropolis]
MTKSDSVTPLSASTMLLCTVFGFSRWMGSLHGRAAETVCWGERPGIEAVMFSSFAVATLRGCASVRDLRSGPCGSLNRYQAPYSRETASLVHVRLCRLGVRGPPRCN